MEQHLKSLPSGEAASRISLPLSLRSNNNKMRRQMMLERNTISEAPWGLLQGIDTKKGLNCIYPLLQQVPYEAEEGELISLSSRIHHENYACRSLPESMIVPDHS